MARFGSTQNAAIGERDFNIRAAADAGIIASNILRAADVALYQAKELGKASIVSFTMLETG
jgi:hypothetical protein